MLKAIELKLLPGSPIGDPALLHHPDLLPQRRVLVRHLEDAGFKIAEVQSVNGLMVETNIRQCIDFDEDSFAVVECRAAGLFGRLPVLRYRVGRFSPAGINWDPTGRFSW